MSEVRHAGLIARRLDGLWRGVLIEGPSGAGKSDLTLRALALGWRLVADDRVRVWRSGGGVYGRAPDVLAGLVEARGLGVVAAPALPFCGIALVLAHDRAPERAPEPACVDLAGVVLPRLVLNLLHASTAAKLEPALASALRGDAASQLGDRGRTAYLAAAPSATDRGTATIDRAGVASASAPQDA